MVKKAIIIFSVFALIIIAVRYIPISSKTLVDSCGPLDKARFSVIFGEKSKYESFRNGTQREAICSTGEKELKLYVL